MSNDRFLARRVLRPRPQVPQTMSGGLAAPLDAARWGLDQGLLADPLGGDPSSHLGDEFGGSLPGLGGENYTGDLDPSYLDNVGLGGSILGTVLGQSELGAAVAQKIRDQEHEALQRLMHAMGFDQGTPESFDPRQGGMAGKGIATMWIADPNSVSGGGVAGKTTGGKDVGGSSIEHNEGNTGLSHESSSSSRSDASAPSAVAVAGAIVRAEAAVVFNATLAAINWLLKLPDYGDGIVYSPDTPGAASSYMPDVDELGSARMTKYAARMIRAFLQNELLQGGRRHGEWIHEDGDAGIGVSSDAAGSRPSALLGGRAEPSDWVKLA